MRNNKKDNKVRNTKKKMIRNYLPQLNLKNKFKEEITLILK